MAYDLKPSPFAPARFPSMPQVAGLRLFTTQSGLKYTGRDDLLLAAFDHGASAAGVFTRSATAAAPVRWCRRALSESGGAARALVVNAGNANAFTGEQGMATARHTAEAAAHLLQAPAHQVQVCSTGVIGEPFEAAALTRHFPAMLSGAEVGWEAAARAIMTTDTYPKGASATVELAGRQARICGIAKGSGMIAPNMATMLAFIFTDAEVPAPLLQELLRESVADTFNCITVDSDTSTNDTVLAFATGAAGAAVGEDNVDAFRAALHDVCRDLALQIVRDGEGISRFVTIRVEGAPDRQAARTLAMSIANSPLVKTAIAGADPNWGRIVMAVGKAGVKVRQEDVRIWIGGQLVAENGAVAPGYSEEEAARHMQGREIDIRVSVGNGAGEITVWTCDLTHAYIDINADYRS